MKASLPHPIIPRLLALLLVSLLAACVEPPRQSGIVDSLNSVSFEPPASGRGVLPPTAGGRAGAGAENGSALARAEIYGASARRPTGGGSRAAAVRADEGVTLNFDRADIREAVRVILGDVLRKNYTIDPQVNGEITLASTAPISEPDLLSVLESALRGNGATLVQVGADTFQILPLENAPANAEVTPIGGRAPTVRPGYGITVVPLRNVSATAAAQFIQPLVSTPEDIRIDSSRNLLLFAGTQSERQSVVDMLADLDVNWLADKAVGIFPLRVSTPEAVIPELQSIFGSIDPNTTDANLVRFVPVARLNAVLAVGTNPGQIEEVERWVARLDRGRTVGTQFYVYNLKHAVAEDVAKLLNEIYSDAPAGGGGEAGFGPAPVGPASLAPGDQDSADGDGGDGGDDTASAPTPAAGPSSSPTLPGGIKVVANRANNSLLIRATPASFETMEATLMRLDTSPLQVLIEATIVEVLLNDALRYGVQYFIKTEGVRIGFTSSVEPSGDSGIEPSPTIPGFNFIFSGGSSNITIDALSRLTNVKVLSSPSVVVQDNREATLTVGDEVPITTRQAVSVEDVDAPVVNSIEYRNTGVILQVRPRINVDGAVSLDIAQEVSRVADAAQSATGELTPTITQRKITSRVAVQSGQTVVLGGLIEDAETRNRDRIPVLGEIPVVGGLFGSTNTANRRTELIVFITPRVIRNALEHRDVSEELRARLKSLRPLTPGAALPPVPQPTAPLPQREPVPQPVPPPGPQPVIPPGTLGQAQAPGTVAPETARQARDQGVPEEWLPDLVGAGPPAAPAEEEIEPPPVPATAPPPEPEQQEAAAPEPDPPPAPPAPEKAAVPLPAARPAEVPPQEPMLLATGMAQLVAAPGAPPRNGFDLARAPVPSRRPPPHVPTPPPPRPAMAPVEWE